MTQAKSTQPKINVRVYADKGSLALRFSTKYNLIFEQLTGFKGKQKCMGLGINDDEKGWKKAQQIALQIEADLEHSDWVKLFDPTWVKYGIGETKYAQKMGELVQMPNQKAAMTVGELWEDYLLWKEGQVQPTTFKKQYQRTYTNIIKGLRWNRKLQGFSPAEGAIYDLPLDATIGEKAAAFFPLFSCKQRSEGAYAALREAYDRAVNLGKIPPTKNPFEMVKSEANSNQMYAPRQDEEGVWRDWWYFEDVANDEELKDVRAFTLAERDMIIKAFYESDRDAERRASTLIEFKFLTGCRDGEAFGLRWKDVSFERGYVRFSKSFDKGCGTTQQTKTGTVRMFKLYPKLTELLLRIQANSSKTGKNDLVFTLMNGNAYGSGNMGGVWNSFTTNLINKDGEKVEYYYPGVVTRLAEQGLIGQYLKPYSTRHTFITLQAQSGTDIPLLAAICGNSIEVIYRHYLGFNKSAEPSNL